MALLSKMTERKRLIHEHPPRAYSPDITGTWLSSRKVLISPITIGHPNWTEMILPVSVTKKQVKNSPAIDTAKGIPATRDRLHGLLRLPLCAGRWRCWYGSGNRHWRNWSTGFSCGECHPVRRQPTGGAAGPAGLGCCHGAFVGSVAGASNGVEHKDGWLSDLVRDAIASNQVVLLVKTKMEHETLVAQEIIKAAVGEVKDTVSTV